jgi:hypothetical protein
MRLIGLLIVLVIIGLLTARELHESGTDANAPLPTMASGVPVVPTHADQVHQFHKQMDQFVDQKNAEQKKQIEQIAQ